MSASIVEGMIELEKYHFVNFNTIIDYGKDYYLVLKTQEGVGSCPNDCAFSLALC